MTLFRVWRFSCSMTIAFVTGNVIVVGVTVIVDVLKTLCCLHLSLMQHPSFSCHHCWHYCPKPKHYSTQYTSSYYYHHHHHCQYHHHYYSITSYVSYLCFDNMVWVSRVWMTLTKILQIAHLVGGLVASMMCWRLLFVGVRELG